MDSLIKYIIPYSTVPVYSHVLSPEVMFNVTDDIPIPDSMHQPDYMGLLHTGHSDIIDTSQLLHRSQPQTSGIENEAVNFESLLSAVSDNNVREGSRSAEYDGDYRSFLQWRCIMCVLLGALVRLSFCCDFGEKYVQVGHKLFIYI